VIPCVRDCPTSRGGGGTVSHAAAAASLVVHVDPVTYLERWPPSDLDEDLRVQPVHDGQREVEVQDGSDYLERTEIIEN